MFGLHRHDAGDPQLGQFLQDQFEPFTFRQGLVNLDLQMTLCGRGEALKGDAAGLPGLEAEQARAIGGRFRINQGHHLARPGLPSGEGCESIFGQRRVLVELRDPAQAHDALRPALVNACRD